MEKTVKIVLVFLFACIFYSCSSSKTDKLDHTYCSLKNFSLRIELSSDTAVYGETVWAKLIVKNNSDEKDSIAYFSTWEILKSPMILKSDVIDTTWVCKELGRFGDIITDYARIPYTVFKPGEEKYEYIYFSRMVYNCANDTTYRTYSHYLIPAEHKVSAHFYSQCHNFERKVSDNTLNLTIVNSSAKAFNELLSEVEDRNKFSSKISQDSVIQYYDSKIEEYKNTPYENEFFLRKLYYRNIISYWPESKTGDTERKLMKEIEHHISKNPDASQVHAMLEYYKIFGYLRLMDTTGTNDFLTSLQKKYPGKRIGVWAKEYLEREW